jgi:hypothetical protein
MDDQRTNREGSVSAAMDTASNKRIWGLLLAIIIAVLGRAYVGWLKGELSWVVAGFTFAAFFMFVVYTIWKLISE